MDPITTAVATFAAKELAKQTIGKAYGFILGKYNLTKLAKFKDKYIEYCNKILHIKTLASQDKSVFIDDIFVPLELAGTSLSSITVHDNTTLGVEERAVLIKGLAGQGKTTILRKLIANNSRRQKFLPIFYEFKNYQGGSIELAISSYLSNTGIEISEADIEKILNDSNVRLYLDAFDESPYKYRSELLDQFQKLINKYNCHIVCTTRPETELDTISDIEIYYVSPLSQDQVFGIIHKTSTDKDKAIELCEALKRSPLHNKSDSILKSPILVVLFCISYNLGEEIPNTLSQFYGNIFDTIFYRHDNLKGKVNRIRHWNDNRRIYRELFDCLCFISQRCGFDSFSRDRLSGFLSDSLRYVGEDEKLSDKILNELITITNLIIEDGFNEYRFVHKSIQEFFTSSFICSLNYGKKSNFTKGVLAIRHFIRFLIIRYSFLRKLTTTTIANITLFQALVTC